MDGGKAGSGAASYNYYGTLFAAVCHGPVDVLYAIIADGKTIYENTSGLAASGNYTNLTGSIDPKYFLSDGYLRFYWGTSAQVASTVATDAGHPAYKNVAKIEASGFLFGKEKTTAPNIEVICARLPVCDTSLCAAIKNVLDDGQVNPVAVLAEMFTSSHGLGWEVARLDATSWAAAGSYCYTNRATCFCSPLFTDHGQFRSAAAALLQMFDGALAWTTTGTLALKLLKYGNDPGGLTTLDANHFSAPPRLALGGWSEVPTGIVARYVDRDRKYKQADEKLDNLIALQVRGEDDRRTVEFPHVTRRDQIVALASQAIRRQMNPGASAELIVRRGFADKFPGDKLKVDVDPEPGGGGTAQLAIVTDRRDDGHGPIKLTVQFDPIAESAPYTPGFTPPNPQAAEVNEIVNALIVPLPGPAIAVLATRPDADIVGMRVLFDTDSGGDFADLGLQPGFAARCTLDAAVLTSGELVVGSEYTIEANGGGADFTGCGAANNNVNTVFTATDTTPTWGTGRLSSTDIQPSDGVLRLSLADGADGPDAYLAGRTAGTEIAAAQDILLAVVANVDIDGRVIVTGGVPELEFCSVVSREAVDADTHNYTVLRGRRNLAERAWDDTAQVWLIPGDSLIAWQHQDMAGLLISGVVGYVELAAFTAYTEDTLLPQFEFVFPESYLIAPQIAWTTPATNPDTLATDGTITPDADLTDADGNMVRVQLFSRDASGLVTVWLDSPLAPSAATTLQDCFTAAGESGNIDLGTQTSADQYFTLTIRATDASGGVVESAATVILEGSSSVGLGGVTFTDEGANSHYKFNIHHTAGGSATEIHAAAKALGSSAPVSWSVFDLDFFYHGNAPMRLWARTSDGVNHGAWQYFDLTG